MQGVRLELPVRGLRWQGPPLGGDGGGPCGSFHRTRSHHRDPSRDHLPPACPPAVFGRRARQRQRRVPLGISRTRYYEWRAIVAAYGLEALMPKERRRPRLPEATPTHVV